MSEAEAMVKIAEAIDRLASAAHAIATFMFFGLLLKNMGTSTDALNNIASAIRRLKE